MEHHSTELYKIIYFASAFGLMIGSFLAEYTMLFYLSWVLLVLGLLAKVLEELGSFARRDYPRFVKAVKLVIWVLAMLSAIFCGWQIAYAQEEVSVSPQVYIPVVNNDMLFHDVIPEVVHGRLLNAETGEPMRNFPIRLTEIWCNSDNLCVWVLDIAFSPGTYTDTDGNFEIIFKKSYNVVQYRPLFGYLDLFFRYYELYHEAYVIPNNAVLDLGEVYTSLNEDPWADWSEGNLVIGETVHIR